jgi:hypothetical protein
MKKLFALVLFTLVCTVGFSQSKSYKTLQDHFSDRDNVHSFNLGGVLCRVAVNIATKDEELWKNLMKDIDHVRFIVIPKEEFKNQNLSVGGFRNYLSKDSFEEVLAVRDKGENVNVFHRTDGNKKNRYFVLVEESNEVVAIEMKGYIDPEFLKSENNKISLSR